MRPKKVLVVVGASSLTIFVVCVFTFAITTDQIKRGILGIEAVTQDMNLNQDSGIDVADVVAASQPQPPTADLRGNVWAASISLTNDLEKEVPINYIVLLSVPDTGDAKATDIKGFDPGKAILAQNLANPTSADSNQRTPGFNRPPFHLSKTIPAGSLFTVQDSGQNLIIKTKTSIQTAANDLKNPFGAAFTRDLELTIPKDQLGLTKEGTAKEITSGVLPSSANQVRNGTCTLSQYAPVVVPPLEQI